MKTEKQSPPARDAVREEPGEMFRHLGLGLRTFRELSGQSQSNIARRAGVGKSQLSKYEAGRELPKFSSLERLLTVLEVSPLTFFYGLSVFERGFNLPHGVEAELLLQPGSTGPLFKAQEGEALRGLFEQFLCLFETSIESRILARLSAGQEPQP